MPILIRVLLPLTLLVGIPTPRAEAAWAKMTGVRHMHFRCTDPIPLDEGVRNLQARTFENAFPFQRLAESYAPAPLLLRVRVGRAFEDYIGGDLSDLATNGEAWMSELDPQSVSPSHASMLRRLDKQGRNMGFDATDRALLEASSAFQIFGITRPELRALLLHPELSSDWKELLRDCKIFSNRDQNYAVILSRSLASAAICLPLPPEELEYYGANGDRPEPEDIPERLAGKKVSEIAFRFFADARHVDLLGCEGFLKRGRAK